MPDDNVETVKALLSAWNRKDVRSLNERVSERLEWHEIGGRPEGSEAGRVGRDAIWDGLESLFETFEYYRLEPESIRDAGDCVVAVVREAARGRASGVAVESRWGYVFRFAEGKLQSVDAYRDAGQALAAVGVREGSAPPRASS